MKKFIGLMLIGACLFSTSVSFASDGPNITKECVIDNAVDMESVVVIGEVSLSTATAVVLSNVKHIPSVITMSAYNDTFKQFALLNKERVDTSFKRYSDRTSIHDFSNSNTGKTKGTKINYYNPNCPCRYITNS